MTPAQLRELAAGLRDEAESITAIAVGRPDAEAKRMLLLAAERLRQAHDYERLAG